MEKGLKKNENKFIYIYWDEEPMSLPLLSI